ncbi:hypothetical protein H4R20_002872 [Coemansia guatemalensis]|uniref:P-loop containing nucleoside triphosphate hydrolase protein n=1 Tax=Coemansia guatemalensis TaxID=2761395 RepID=A0A9W8LT64_9FUNG|nr:hypothetical protein H4R20_002872 [Coemansia guatemalensis]
MAYQCPSTEGWGPTSPTYPTHLTTCFQLGFLAPGLNALFLAAAAVRLRKLSGMPRLPSEVVTGHILWAKLSLAAVALAASAVEFITMAQLFPYVCVYTISLALQTVAAAAAVWLHYKEQHHNRIASTPLLLFWLVAALISLMRLRTALSVVYINDFSTLVAPISLLTLAALTNLILECQSKPRELFKQADSSIGDKIYGKLEDSDEDYCTADSPEERANVFSRYTYTWVGSLLRKGYRKQLQLEDMWKLTGQYRPDIINAQFRRNWKKELETGKPSLFRATARTYWRIWALEAMHETLRVTTSLLQPVVLSRLIEFATTYGTDKGSPIEHGYFYAIVLFLASCEQNVALRLRWSYALKLGIHVRTSYMSAIYQKSLKLSNDARQKYDIGSTVTHMSIDAENVATFFEIDSQDMWSDPLHIILSLCMLYQLMGWSALVGVVVMLACIPVMSRIGKSIGVNSNLLMEYRDKRMGIMSEVLAGIRVIKMYAWESSFIQRINDVRVNLELNVIRKNGVLNAMIEFMLILVPFAVPIAAFGAYSLFGNQSHGPLDARIIFVGLSLLGIARVALFSIPNLLPKLLTTIASLRRITEFLTASEIDFTAIDRQPYDRDSADSNAGDILVSLQGGSFKWSSADEPALVDVEIQCKREELVAVIGRVGSGKSSLISAILGDMIKCSGDVTVCGSIAYVAQQPWILNATLRDNILFGSDYEGDYYNRVIDACALRQDLDNLPAGDITEIGERGINLSGGQKMRVSLARAVYSRADVYVLDDPLAAVDAHVSKHLFTHVLGPRGMLHSRARILVTNAVQYLKDVDNIVMLHDGKIIEQGSFAQAMDNQGDIFEFIHRHVGDSQISTESSSNSSDTECVENNPDKADRCNTTRKQPVELVDADVADGPIVQHDRDAAQDGVAGQTEDAGRIITTETRREGKVEWSTYNTYVNACGKGNVNMLYIGFVLAVAGDVCANLWLRYWSSSSADASEDSTASSTHSPMYYLYIYGGIGLLGAAMNLLKALVLWTRCSIKASTEVHQSTLNGVMRSPMSFFDTTPTGRILNRFSSDVESCDQSLSPVISNLMELTSLIASALAIIGITMPRLLIITPLLAIGSRYYQKQYISSSREVRRLFSTTRSPIFAHFHESAAGITTIRAYNQQSRFASKNEYHVGQYMRTDTASLLLDQWLAMRLETIGNILMLGAALNAVATMHRSGTGDGGLIGVVISNTLVMAGAFNWLMRAISDIEVCMTHLERAVEYGNLPSEAANIIEDCRPKEVWPEQGVVEFKNYSTRYREGLDLVLKDLSFRVLPRQKVGIVGRTGAGKSSLTLALFRIIEAAGGQILLDGEDISQYGLLDVRSKLSIIPQDPVLFAGTVRENLDPFGSYSDQDIWRALEQAHLAEYIRSKDERLEYMVTQSGENLSVGQRQLICLARALLKHAKVLVLDEATAAIDNETDGIIQQTIRSEFKDCTVLTIAHRLNTVVDSDMILVIDGGRVAEYDTPQNLLANRDSIFAKLVEEAQNSRAH